jgi:phage gpG-like protein
MAATGASVTIDTRGLQRKLNKWQKGITEKHLLQAIANIQIRWIVRNFKEEGIERRWAPLSERTIAMRRKGPRPGSADKPLQDTRKLLGSFTRGMVPQMSGVAYKGGSGFRMQGRSVTVGTNVEYAPKHEYGTKRIPKRKMLPTPRAARKIAVDGIEGILKDLRRGAH